MSVIGDIYKRFFGLRAFEYFALCLICSIIVLIFGEKNILSLLPYLFGISYLITSIEFLVYYFKCIKINNDIKKEEYNNINIVNSIDYYTSLLSRDLKKQDMLKEEFYRYIKY